MWKKWIIFACICFWSNHCSAEFKYKLSACMIFKDEAPYLKEWIEFHRLVGVEHFYLCSHNSTDNYLEVLQPYIKKRIVELKEIKTELNQTVVAFANIQLGFYNECIEKAKNESQWLAVIDSDEFLFPTQEKSLVKVLKRYNQFAGVGVNWQMFGTSFIDKIPPGELIIQWLIRCAPKDMVINTHIKSIVQPTKVQRFDNPHYAIYLPGYNQVNTDEVPFEGPFSPYVQVDQLRINHYWTRDEHYYLNYKLPRQNLWWGGVTTGINDYNEEVDESIQRFVPKLMKRMKSRVIFKSHGRKNKKSLLWIMPRA
jgi:Glycosyltransferase family 92